ncbi:MAG TPA: septum formation family protein [Beutenbergiaceae bacterium]|nr:septum formation family protein [Beutenbergiaceae bacterium]
MLRTARIATAVVGGLGLALTMAACSATVPTADRGDCVDTSEMGGPDGVTEIPTVDCTEEHDGQVIHVYEIGGDDFPGEDAIIAQAHEECVSGFEEFVGSDFMESQLDVFPLYPTADTWEQADDREVLCIAMMMDGSSASESWENSGI